MKNFFLLSIGTLLIAVNFAFAQNGAFLSEESSILLPPENIEINVEDDGVTIFWNPSTTNTLEVTEYHVFKKCDSMKWTKVVKVPVLKALQTVYKTHDKTVIDGCKYAVLARSDTGMESELSRASSLVVSTQRANISTKPSLKDVLINTKQDTTIAQVNESTKIDVESAVTSTNSKKSISVDTKQTIPEKKLIREALKKDIIPVSGMQQLTLEIVTKLSPELAIVDMELFIKKNTSNRKEYLGMAEYNAETDTWGFVFDSKTYPNGDYLLIPRGVSFNGMVTTGVILHIRIINKAAPVETTDIVSYQRDLVKHMKEIEREVVVIDKELEKKERVVKEELKKIADVPNQKTRQSRLEEKMDDAINRGIDEMTVLSIEEKDDELVVKRRQIAKQFNMSFVQNRNIDKDNNFKIVRDKTEEIEEHILSLEKIAEERKNLLSNRVRSDVFEDADFDGISNFDEIHIYNTDPFNTDTDDDGLTDGAEIIGGFDPTNAQQEAIIEYEDVRKAGIVNSDTFAVIGARAIVKEVRRPRGGEVLTGVTNPIDGNNEINTIIETVVAIEFSGIALPNSFVTLYIFSTPIIVTVKTDSDGNWSYVFDKELEDGEHVVFVAMTDNAGSVYMKSNPFNFVKEAQAITHEQPIFLTAESPGFFDGKYRYGVLGIVIVMIIGLLIFLGNRPERNFERTDKE